MINENSRPKKVIFQTNLVLSDTPPQGINYLPATYDGNSNLVISTLDLTIGGQPVRLQIPLPTEKVTAETMLPLFQELTNFLVEMSVKSAEKEGKQISCQKGCGACCSQLVPITELEINHLKKVVNEMPAAQQTEIHRKFKQAIQQLAAANLLEKLRRPQHLNKDQRLKLGLDYFQLNVPCPFLESQSCSIHPHRPMACREYLVTSPVKHCSTPQLGAIEGIKIPRKISHAVTKLTKQQSKTQSKTQSHWLPLILALEQPKKPVNKQKRQSGMDWLKDVLTKLT